ncbi:RNA polymerase sigma factor SigE [Knoellia sp. 3-2P3]|uniref:RNA polymerase sigma factor SigE n=1 Tax=Knoellia sp. 3-2P3 TaxID=3032285 RepID=UPI0023DB0A1B|nr:RNA polymerase sigma factor SigE [Knoellia sp. 3-2P3]MDF2093406.1 RNA polymerase sigma factor SigE [Knoellia sp. 3-2P3]
MPRFAHPSARPRRTNAGWSGRGARPAHRERSGWWGTIDGARSSRPATSARSARPTEVSDVTATDQIGAPDRAAVAVSPEQPWVPPTWEEIVEQHSARVYRLAYRLTGNVHDAEDLTHDVFIRVFRSLHSYQPGTFEGWLHRITTNVFLDRMRRKQRIRFDALSEESAARLPTREAGPEQAFEANHFNDDVQRALDALPPDFRAAVVLCDIEGLSYEEIATTLGIKLGTVRSRIHRGRALLREALAHRAPGTRPVEPTSPAESSPGSASSRRRLPVLRRAVPEAR